MRFSLFTAVFAALLVLPGCSMVLPEISHQPVIRNPFPQLNRVAVAPFFNQSDESTVDGRVVAMAYFAELQRTPGFEVVPVGVVEEAIIANRVDLYGPGEARRLAQLLGVDAVVVGSITDYSPYYPPRLGLRVEWYTANPGFHKIPAGYGLPWNTPEEEYIPDSLAYEAKLELARTQMADQAPPCNTSLERLSPPPQEDDEAGSETTLDPQVQPAAAEEELPAVESTESSELDVEVVDPPAAKPAGSGELVAPSEMIDTPLTTVPTMPVGLCPANNFPCDAPPGCMPHNGPVLSHTRIYRGTDPDLTEALKSYVYFREDARFGGWEAYLQRSDDFLRFCCHMHISEMLSARGGSRKTRVVWRWPDSR